ncbi:MAG: VTT domain-containing protein [Alphaproteobacteria bacterium]|jgi:membrane protein YqaA with SNARE-associated domain|nr:VTT domain-containing protein [Alphaproteobacteria bacterium]
MPLSLKNSISNLQDKIIAYSKSKHALAVLIVVAFTESSFFLIPPDIFLFTMAMAHPKKAWFYALITTVSSVIGGLFGYLLGYLFFDMFIYDFIVARPNYFATFTKFKEYYDAYAALATFIAGGFTPIPYKIATITSGALQANLFTFILASIAARGMRFFVLAYLVIVFHKKGKDIIMKHFRKIALIVSLILLVAIVLYILYSMNYI